MSEHSKHACQETGSSGRVCYLVKDHPGRVHVDVTDGGLVVWSLPDGESFRNIPLNDGDPERDAPERLRLLKEVADAPHRMAEPAKPCGHLAGTLCLCEPTLSITSEQLRDRVREQFRKVEPAPTCGAHQPGGTGRCTEREGHEGDHLDVIDGVGWRRYAR